VLDVLSITVKVFVAEQPKVFVVTKFPDVALAGTTTFIWLIDI
jgi:hypothetical protein